MYNSCCAGDIFHNSVFWDDLEASSDLITQGFKQVIDRFNEDYAGKYHVTPITTQLEPYYTDLNALVDAQKTPDVFIVSPGPNLTDYVAPGIAAPLDEYLEADGWKDTFAGDAVFAQQTYDGKIYAIPLNTAAACVFYNKEIFEAAGAAVWVNEKTIAAGTKLLELSKYFQETAAGDSNDDATTALYMEEAAILIQGSWAIGQMNGGNPDFEAKCGVFQFPAIEGANDPNRIIAKSDSLAMSSTTKYPEACIALMKYFTDDTAQKYTAEVGGKIPVTKVEYDADKAPAQLADVMAIFGNASATFGFYNESLVSSDAGSYFDDQMVAMFQKEKTPEEAFQAVQDWYQNYFAEQAKKAE